MEKLPCAFILCFFGFIGFSQPINRLTPDPNPPTEIQGMKLVWADEFNLNGKPNPEFWKYEKGFVRNEELQWSQEENANCRDFVRIYQDIEK